MIVSVPWLVFAATLWAHSAAGPSNDTPVKGMPGDEVVQDALYDDLADLESLVTVLAEGTVEGAPKRLSGGLMRKFVLQLDHPVLQGCKAVFKPIQDCKSGDYRREVAGWELARLLRIDNVPPAVVRQFPISQVAPSRWARADLLEGLGDLDVGSGDHGLEIPGALIYWVKGARDAFPDGGEQAWVEGLMRQVGGPGRMLTDVTEARDFTRLVVFDYLQSNPDRFSGGNLLRDGVGKLWFIDNASSFLPCKRPETLFRRLHRFDRDMIEALRRAQPEEMTARLQGLLSTARISGLLERRRLVLERVDSLVEEHGDDLIYIAGESAESLPGTGQL